MFVGCHVVEKKEVWPMIIMWGYSLSDYSGPGRTYRFEKYPRGGNDTSDPREL